MKQIVIISGKGGTGKTVLTAAFAALAGNSARGARLPDGQGSAYGGKVIADCDVDAADLHLLLNPKILERNEFKSGKTAVIDQNKCIQCGKCIEVCRFNAITDEVRGSRFAVRRISDENRQGTYPQGKYKPKTENQITIDPISCEGCAFCSFVCPVGAIKMEENTSGEWFISETRFGSLVHAKLGIAEENSGKLIALVRQKAKEIAEKQNCDWVIIDGAPGIGCPVIASISGVDCALIVTEPTLSGLHDADRVIGVAKHFGVSVKLVINKHDLNIEMSKKIEKYCEDKNIPIIGKIGFDKSVVKAMVGGKTIIEYPDGRAKQEISEIWTRLQREIC